METKNRESLYIKPQGADRTAIRTAINGGFSWLISVCASTSQRIDALLAVPSKSQLTRGYFIAEVIEKVSNALVKGQKVKLPNSLGELRLMTERQTVYSWDGPILAIYPTKKLLDKIDGLSEATHVLVIPWIFKDIEWWINTWSAHELGTAPKPTKRLRLNPVVIEALKDLTSGHPSLGHPSDKAAAIDLFQRLEAASEVFDPKEVRAWLVSEGYWRPEHADKVMKIAEAVLEGKRLRGGRQVWRDDIVEQWRERARQ